MTLLMYKNDIWESEGEVQIFFCHASCQISRSKSMEQFRLLGKACCSRYRIVSQNYILTYSKKEKRVSGCLLRLACDKTLMFIKNLTYTYNPSLLLTFKRYILSVSVKNFYKTKLGWVLHFICQHKSIEIDTVSIKYVVFKCNNCCEISWQKFMKCEYVKCMICFEIFWQFYFLIKEFLTIQEMQCWLGVDFFWLQVQSKTVLFDVFLKHENYKNVRKIR